MFQKIFFLIAIGRLYILSSFLSAILLSAYEYPPNTETLYDSLNFVILDSTYGTANLETPT